MQENALQSHVLIESAVGILSTACGSEAKKLRQNKEVVVQGSLNVGSGLLSELSHEIGLFLLELLLQGLLLVCQAGPELLVKFLVLGELLLEREELGLKLRTLEMGSLLIGIDDPGSDKLVKGLAGMLVDYRLNPGRVRLERANIVSHRETPEGRFCGVGERTIFLVTLRMLLQRLSVIYS